MKKLSKPVALILLAFLLVLLAAVLIANTHGFHDSGMTLMMFDEDMSDSAAAWLIVIPILVLVAIIVIAVVAGAAVIAAIAVAFAFLMVVLGLLLAMLPFAIVLGIPVLAIYGIFKLVQRDRRAAAVAGV